ncbi:MAG: transglutaminase-like domain-containing protein [Bacteroidota bacterium]
MYQKTTLFLGLVLLLCSSTSFITAQQTLPVIQANSLLVDIRDGDSFNPEAWTIVPDVSPDVYTSNSVGKTVTFYTDLDSISYVLDKDQAFDFIILVNGKDSALTRIAYEPSKLDILRASGPYAETTTDLDIPPFTYQDASAEPLRSLREKYNLDSIAGNGNDVSKMLNLMRWVHNTVEHDGGKSNPATMNADYMITTCGEKQGTLNCRGLGIVLNECFLAMGIPSRFVTCKPKDPNDYDCHVINMAFSYDLDKWLWMDPTQNGYIMDEHGELLGISEVRDRLLEGGALILNPDANWNYRSTTYKGWYLDYYMAKNLYWFSTPLHSTYDLETHDKEKHQAYLELLPTGFGEEADRQLEQSFDSGMKRTTYITNNAALFWAKPEQKKVRR